MEESPRGIKTATKNANSGSKPESHKDELKIKNQEEKSDPSSQASAQKNSEKSNNQKMPEKKNDSNPQSVDEKTLKHEIQEKPKTIKNKSEFEDSESFESDKPNTNSVPVLASKVDKKQLESAKITNTPATIQKPTPNSGPMLSSDVNPRVISSYPVQQIPQPIYQMPYETQPFKSPVYASTPQYIPALPYGYDNFDLVSPTYNDQLSRTYYDSPKAESFERDSNLENILGDKNYRTMQYIDESVFSGMLFLFVFWKMIKSKHINPRKLLSGSMRSVGVYFLFISNLFMCLYNGTIVYLTQYYDFDKSSIEKIGFLSGQHYIKIYSMNIDVVQILNISLSLYQILRASTLFLLIGLWLPCAFSLSLKFKSASSEDEKITGEKTPQKIRTNEIQNILSHASIVTFAYSFAFFRIPLAFLIDFNRSFSNEKSAIFYRSIYYGTELYLSVLFFLLLETRLSSFLLRNQPIFYTQGFEVSPNGRGPLENVNILVALLAIYGFAKYYINIIAVPVDLSPFYTHLVSKIAFVTEFCITLLIASMLNPFAEQIEKKTSEQDTEDHTKKSEFDHPNLISEKNNDAVEPFNTGKVSPVLDFQGYRDQITCGK